jgi:co-chaperonin GroES (HSP10)
VLQGKTFSRGAELSHKTTTFIPADAKIRPTQDHIVVEPLDGVLSSIIEVIHECKPLKGTVLAVGPGIYPKKYDHPDKHKRTKYWDGKRFRPTEVKVGDVVELGGLDIGGYAFQTFYWGEKLCLMAQERDVAAVHERAAA